MPIPQTLVRPGIYRFDSGEWTIAVEFRNGAKTVRVDIPVPRVSLHNLSGSANSPDRQVVWRDEVDRIVVAGTVDDVALISPQPGRSIGTLQLNAGRSVVELDHAAVGQVLEEQPLCSVHAQRKDREVFSGLYLGSEEYVEASIISKSFEFREGDLPTQFSGWFRSMRGIADCRPIRLGCVSLPRNQRLRDLTFSLLTGAREFDGAVIEDQEALELLGVNSPFSAIIDWHRLAKRLFDGGGGDADALADVGLAFALEVIPLQRWRDDVIEIAGHLTRLPSVLRDRFRRFRDAIAQDLFGSPRTEFDNEPGCAALVRSLQAYTRAGKNSDGLRVRWLLTAKTQAKEAISVSTVSGMVRPLARIVTALVFWRRGNIQESLLELDKDPIPDVLQSTVGAMREHCLGQREPVAVNEVAILVSDIFAEWPSDAGSGRRNTENHGENE
jgi:hypothetical protein